MGFKKHKGIRNYTSEEISNLAIGQNGFDIIGDPSSTTEVEAGVTASVVDARYWIAIKAINGEDAVSSARSLDTVQGDDFALSGTYNAGSSTVVLENGDIVYGAFDKIYVASGDFVLAYRG